MRRIGALLLAVLAGFFAGGSARASATGSGGLLLRGTIVTMNAHRTIRHGGVLVKDGKIKKLLSATAPAPADAIVIETNGIIYPGLMNLHDHIAYNFLPLYPVPKNYTNRDQWPSGALYERLVNNPKNLVTEPTYFALQTEALKYAELKALAGGETAIQGSPTDAGTSTILVRNVELSNFGVDRVGERGLSIDRMFVRDLAHQKDSIGKLDAWLFHLSEGVDDHARREYSNPAYDPAKPVGPKNQAGLKQLGLVTKQLVGIHCTALQDEDFEDWERTAGEGPKIVWSPLSNLLLYGKTTDIPAARRHKALVALGTDWSPSGSKNLLWELKVADQVDGQIFKGALEDRDLVAMVTCNPAAILGWQDHVGSIKEGMDADLVVVDDRHAANPYRNLIEAVEANVQLVLVGGVPVYGDRCVLEAAAPGCGCEPIAARPAPDREKAVLFTYRGVRKGSETLDQVTDALYAACKLSPDDLAKRLNEDEHARASVEKWLVATKTHRKQPVPANLNDSSQPITVDEVRDFMKLKFPSAAPLHGIDPIFEQTDDAYFTALEANLHFVGASATFDPKPLEAFRGVTR